MYVRDTSVSSYDISEQSNVLPSSTDGGKFVIQLNDCRYIKIFMSMQSVSSFLLSYSGIHFV